MDERSDVSSKITQRWSTEPSQLDWMLAEKQEEAAENWVQVCHRCMGTTASYKTWSSSSAR